MQATRRAGGVAYGELTGACQALTQRSPSTLACNGPPRNIFPSTQRFPFRATPTQPQAPRATSDAVQNLRVSS